MSEWWEQTSKQMSEWPSTLRVYFLIIRLTMHSFVVAIVSTFVQLHPLTKSALVYVSKSIRLYLPSGIQICAGLRLTIGSLYRSIRSALTFFPRVIG